VLVTLCELGETTAESLALNVSGGVVDLSCEVSGKPWRILLNLAGDEGQSPRLKVTQGERVLLDRDDLTVPPGTPG
jgi:hypothetical protein